MDRIADLGMAIARPAMVNAAHTAVVADTELVSAAQGGDRDAFGQLYQRFAATIHGILLARVPRGEVDDLVQDVFVAAFQRLPSLRSPAAFGSWLATIARNRAVDYHRKPATEPIADDVPDTGSSAHVAEARAVLAVIQSLPPAYRETLVLRLVEGMTGPEIAQRTGLTHASVRVNLHRGMKQLRRALEREAGAR